MTPEEIEQPINEKVTIAISVCEAIRSTQVGNKAVKGQETITEDIEKGYLGNYSYCDKCDKHHLGPCPIVYNRCQKIGHKVKHCRNPAPITKAVTPGTCYKYGEMGHFRNDCSRLRKSMLKKIQGKAYMMIPREAVETNDTGTRYKGNHPYCVKYARHHTGRCTIVCNRCKEVDHMAKNCQIATPMPITAIPTTCYGYEAAGYFEKN